MLVFIVPLFPVMDLVTLPIQLIVWAVSKEAPWEWFSSYDGTENQIYLASAEYNVYTEYYSLMEKMYSYLPETEIASLKQSLNSIPETERISSIEKITSLPESKLVSLVSIYNSLPESEIAASIKRINALSEIERVSLLRSFNSLSEAEFDSLMEELKSLTRIEYIASVNYFREAQ
jgi:predicted HAD superfamily phosphohydrolase